MSIIKSIRLAFRIFFRSFYREAIRFYASISPKKSPYLIASLVPYSKVSSKILCYAKACKIFSYSPNVEDKQTSSLSNLPDLFFRSIKDSYFIIYSPCFLLKNGILAYPDSISIGKEDPIRFESFPLGLVQRNSLIHVLRDPAKYSKNITGRAFIVGGTSNWYHFIFEILPKIYLVDKHFAEEPQNIIVTRECLEFPNFSAAIKLFSSYHNLVVAGARQIINLEEAITIDDFNVAPLNVKSKLELHTSDWKINSFILNEFATQLRSRLLNLANPYSVKDKKIFLARKLHYGRSYNQDSLIKISSQFGFQVCFLEEYTLTEQFELISSTQYLVGPPGSAWTSLIFSERPLTCLSWVPYGRFQLSSLYSTISKTFGHHMTFFYSGFNTRHSSQIKNPYFVDPETFRSHLSMLLMS